MDQRLMDLLLRQHESGFADLGGTRVAATVPVPDRLINEAVAASLPRGGRIAQLQVTAQPDHRLTVRVTLAKPSFVPPLTIRMQIERQPEFPGSPFLVFKLTGGGLMVFAGPLATLFDVLPPGVRMEGDRILVHIGMLLQQRGLDGWLRFLERLHVSTEAGSVILALEARIPPRSQP